MFYPGIRTRITLPYLIAIAVTAAVGVFVVTRLVAGSVQERFNNQLIDSAQAASNTVADIERQQLATLRLMAFTEGLPEAVQDADTGAVNRLLRPIAVNEQADSVIVFDVSGEGIYHLRRLEQGGQVVFRALRSPDLSSREGVRRILTQETDLLGDKFVDIVEEDTGLLLYINAPVVNEEGQLVGGISLGLTADHLAKRIGEQSLSAVTLFQSDGQVLGSTFRPLEAESLSMDSAAMTLLVEEAEQGSPIKKQDIGGIGYQTLYSPLEIRSQPIGLVGVSLSSGFIVDRVSTSRNTFAALFTALFTIIALLGFATARSIIRPVTQLVDTTRAIRAGDLSRRVELKTPDELGELGVSFDHMTNQLVQRNREMNAVLASITDAVIVQDFDQHILMNNRAADKLLGKQEVQKLLHQPEAMTEPHTIALEEKFFSTLSTPVRMDDDTLLGHVVVFRDITALIQAEQLKDEMMKQLSHELRTPLSAARGYLELAVMLGQAAIPQQSMDYLNNSLSGLNTLERMVNQVIDVSAIISNQFFIEMEDFNLVEVIEQQVQTWLPLCEKRGLTLSTDFMQEKMSIEGDSHRIGQVIDHLLSNAYSYTLPGGSIKVGLGCAADAVTVVVQDTGVGIAEHELSLVFERMYRGQSADAGPTDTRGLGLGLYFSKYIIEAHHGTIELVSQRDVGTKVRILLPVSQNSDGV
ncbi:MAG: HAMP domain-containing protein [Anaerolineae bacterium]|nr:HAMP domain-containing protein [Anaerolineae bacterium]